MVMEHIRKEGSHDGLERYQNNRDKEGEAEGVKYQEAGVG